MQPTPLPLGCSKFSSILSCNILVQFKTVLNRQSNYLFTRAGGPDASACQPCWPGRTFLVKAKSDTGTGSAGTGMGHAATEAIFLL